MAPVCAPLHLHPVDHPPHHLLLTWRAFPRSIMTWPGFLVRIRLCHSLLTVPMIAQSISFRGPLYPWGDCTTCRSPRRRRCAIMSPSRWHQASSPVAAGFFFVAKKDGSLRPCIDYRQLNSITVKNKYPLLLLSSTFEPLTHAKVFTKLDLRNAYHLIRVREGDEWKTGFNTHLGHFEYLVMPFGLTNAPAVFQALVNDVLRDFLNIFVVVYLDDILVFSKTTTEHSHHVRQVLQRLLENRLFVKAEICRVSRSCPGGGTGTGGSQEGAGGVAAPHGSHPPQTFSWVH